MLNGPLCIHSVYVARYYCENLYFIPCFLLDKQKKKVIDIACFTAKQYIYISSRHKGIFTDFLLYVCLNLLFYGIFEMNIRRVFKNFYFV